MSKIANKSVNSVATSNGKAQVTMQNKPVEITLELQSKVKEFAERFNIVDFNLPFTESNLFTEHKKFIYYNFVECYGLEKLEEMCKWNPQILVSSIHHVKGGEARNVALLLDTTRKVDINLYNKIDEELRVLYVAVTRTKENLILIDSSHGEGYGKIIETVKEENELEW